MWVRLVSDLHLEFFQPYAVDHHEMLPPDDRDSETVLILAGDIVMASKMKEYLPFFRELGRRFKAIVYVMGNHEYYKTSFQGARDSVRSVFEQKYLENFHLLENSSVGFGDVIIWGATLWTDMNSQNPLCMADAAASMPEYGGIVMWDCDGEGREIFKPHHSVTLHNESLFHMKEFLRDFGGDNYRRIIVTHHLPSYESVDPMYKGSKLNGAFASELSYMIESSPKTLYMHGHTHQRCDYPIGESRIVCNPLGYPNHGDEGKYFDPSFFIEV